MNIYPKHQELAEHLQKNICYIEAEENHFKYTQLQNPDDITVFYADVEYAGTFIGRFHEMNLEESTHAVFYGSNGVTYQLHSWCRDDENCCGFDLAKARLHGLLANGAASFAVEHLGDAREALPEEIKAVDDISPPAYPLPKAE